MYMRLLTINMPNSIKNVTPLESKIRFFACVDA